MFDNAEQPGKAHTERSAKTLFSGHNIVAFGIGGQIARLRSHPQQKISSLESRNVPIHLCVVDRRLPILKGRDFASTDIGTQEITMKKFALAAAAMLLAAGSAVAADNLSNPNLSDRPTLWQGQTVDASAAPRQEFGITLPAGQSDDQPRDSGASDYYR